MFDRDEILHLLGLIESTLSTIEERCKEDVTGIACHNQQNNKGFKLTLYRKACRSQYPGKQQAFRHQTSFSVSSHPGSG